MQKTNETLTLGKAIEIASKYVTTYKKTYIKKDDRKFHTYQIDNGMKLEIIPVKYSASWYKWRIRFYLPNGNWKYINEIKRIYNRQKESKRMEKEDLYMNIDTGEVYGRSELTQKEIDSADFEPIVENIEGEKGFDMHYGKYRPWMPSDK